MADEESLDPPHPLVSKVDYIDTRSVGTEYVDWIATFGVIEGVLNITLGTIDHAMRATLADPIKVAIAARLRMSFGFAERLHTILGDELERARKQEGGAYKPPPTNMIN